VQDGQDPEEPARLHRAARAAGSGTGAR
jgi:hypothetical protein